MPFHRFAPRCSRLPSISIQTTRTTTLSVLDELANLTASVCDKDSHVVNPSPLYQALEQSTRLDPHELGDAAKALRILLHTLQQDSSLLQPILEHYMGGTLEQTLVGEWEDFRRIQTKTRLVPCPFSILANNASSLWNLKDALANATILPQTVLGVDWNQISNYKQEPKNSHDDLDCDGMDYDQNNALCIPATLLDDSFATCPLSRRCRSTINKRAYYSPST